MAINTAGRNIPDSIPGYGEVLHFGGHDKRIPEGNRYGKKNRATFNNRTDKTLPDIKAAISASGLKSGMTVSFHHHLRNGDFVVNAVMDACAEMVIRDLVLFPTALFGVHKQLTKHIKSGDTPDTGIGQRTHWTACIRGRHGGSGCAQKPRGTPPRSDKRRYSN